MADGQHGKINMENLKESFLRDGYIIFKNEIPREKLLGLTSVVDEWRKDADNILSHLPPGRRGAIPNAINNPHFQDMTVVFDLPNVYNFMRYLWEGDVMYGDHFDAHINFSSGWHEDNQMKHFKEGNQYQGIDPFETYKVKKDDETLAEKYEMMRVAIYLQDHEDNPDGLSVRPGTHLHRFDKRHPNQDPGVDVNTSVGDVIVFDPRLVHRGTDYETSVLKSRGQNRYSIFFAFGKSKSIFSEMSIMGAIQRQVRQNKNEMYVLQDYVRSKLKEYNVLSIDEAGVYYRPY